MSSRKPVVSLSSSSRTLSEGLEAFDASAEPQSSGGGVELLSKIDSSVVNPSGGKSVADESSGELGLAAMDLFLSKACLNWESCVVEGSPEAAKIDKCVVFGSTYTHHFPSVDDRIWLSLKPGWHAVPTIFFDFGLRIPMHPFLPLLFEALGCGFAQLSPNSFAQVMGVIARCREYKVLPSLELLFAIFRVKTIGGQVYLDKKTGHTRLVKVPLSNSGWQAKWSYLEGGEFERIKPWDEVPRSRLDALSSMLHPFSSTFQISFMGNLRCIVLENFLMLISYLLTVVRMFLTLFLVFVIFPVEFVIVFLFFFVYLGAVAGKSLTALLSQHPKMPSDAVLAMLTQRGATSVVNQSVEGAVEAGAEGSSRAAAVDLDVVDDELVEVKGNSGIVTRDKAKKRLRKDGGSPKHHHFKKPKEVPSSSGGGANLQTAMDRAAELEILFGKNPRSKKQVLKDFKGHLDHLSLLFCSCVSFPFSNM